MPPHTNYCAHSQCSQSTRADKPSFKYWYQFDRANFWPEDWGIKENEDKICKECYDEKLALQKSLHNHPQTRHGPIIPDPPRAKAAKRGEAEFLTSTPHTRDTSGVLMPVPAARGARHLSDEYGGCEGGGTR